MVKRILFILLIIFTTQFIYSQIEPPNIVFEDLKENWLFVSKDTNLIKLNISPYSRHTPIDVINDDDYIYILENSWSQNLLGGPEGCFLYKINRISGIIDWTYYNNYYSGNRYREFFYYQGGLKLLNNGNIELMGYRDMDTIDLSEIKVFGFYSNPIKRILDGETGEVLFEKFGNDTARTIYNFTGFSERIYHIANEDVMKFRFTDYEKNDSIFSSLEIYNINQENCTIDTPYVTRISYNSGSNGSIYKIPSPITSQMSQDTMIVLFFANDPSDLKHSPSKLTLVWLDTHNKNNIHIIKSKDITDVVYYPQSAFNEYIDPVIKDNNIFVYQKAEERPGKSFYWIAWYDKEGNFKGKIDKFTNEKGENYSHVLPIGVINMNAYFAGYNISTKGYDILRMKPNTNKYEKIKEMIVDKPKDILSMSMYMWDAKTLPDDKLLVNLKINIKYSNENQTSFTYYYNFNLSDLGILTRMDETLDKNDDIVISPNPVSKFLTISMEIASSGLVKLVDINGNNVLEKLYENTKKIQVNVSNLKSGIYILINKDYSGNESKKKILIMK